MYIIYSHIGQNWNVNLSSRHTGIHTHTLECTHIRITAYQKWMAKYPCLSNFPIAKYFLGFSSWHSSVTAATYFHVSNLGITFIIHNTALLSNRHTHMPNAQVRILFVQCLNIRFNLVHAMAYTVLLFFFSFVVWFLGVCESVVLAISKYTNGWLDGWMDGAFRMCVACILNIFMWTFAR